MPLFSLIKKGEVHLHKKQKIIPQEEFSQALTAKELIDIAEEQAKTLIQEAEKEAISIKEKAAADGHQEGLTKFQAHLLFFEEKFKMLRYEMQKNMLPLVLKSVKKIVGDRLELDPANVVHIVMESIKATASSKFVKIFVHEQDLKYLEQEKESLKQIFKELESLEIVPRPDVTRGGCIIETERGVINATLENQFRALETAYEAYQQSP